MRRLRALFKLIRVDINKGNYITTAKLGRELSNLPDLLPVEARYIGFNNTCGYKRTLYRVSWGKGG